MRSGIKTSRYRLHNREGMIQLINCINGYILHSSRVLQLDSVAQQLNIYVIEPMLIYRSSQWFAGFFDAELLVNI
jgi:hypothetical protein